MIRVRSLRSRVRLYDIKLGVFLADLVSTLWNVGLTFLDALLTRLPRWRHGLNIAFIVHPPEEHHLFTPYPLLRYLPPRWSLWLAKYAPPCRIGTISLRRNGRPVAIGWLLGVMIAPAHLLEANQPHHLTRADALHRVKQCITLARRLGAHIIGLGAYLPSLTRNGTLLLDHSAIGTACITIGHACTAVIVRDTLYAIASDTGVDLNRETVAIVGAAGSTGATITRLLAREGVVSRLLLVDLPHKMEALRALSRHVNNPSLSTSLRSLRTASIIVTVTTAPGSIISPEHIGRPTIIIDDSMPRNTDKDILAPLLADGRLLILDVLAEVPGLAVSFHYDVDPVRPTVTYTCLAEVIALHETSWNSGHYSIGETPVDRISDVSERLRLARITPPLYTSFRLPLSRAAISRFQDCRLSYANHAERSAHNTRSHPGDDSLAPSLGTRGRS
jgi:fatty aldehyde-generating acyl-ACP reductase